MKKYKLKEKYQGVIITKLAIGIGEITFNPFVVTQDYYHNYINLGFGELFELYTEEKNITPPTIINELKTEKVVTKKGRPRKNSVKNKILDNEKTNS